MTKTLPITQARDELTSLVHNAKNKLAEYVITVNGSPAAVIISANEYASWKETNEILSDTELMRAIKEGEKDMKRDDYITLEDLKKQLSS
ncbi:hypothetical protein A3B02_01840 [Candidatus Roizmanbacteria bacterium RIFCSPLOWO2_01_FULL_42_14]|uniref:Antitoxin n=2 Tax=Candidatus Roizmaniibacteriota TaxID=1752723 RepID=A0A1F7K226_9BACT|nr:MAG: hypothetical protein A3B02_01840 [Candidatus Roizmanbacteria bacterium RIFCSPLOWO2_01_FULL_42_14]OGK61928.1 MAG: hypothetical protein A3I56_04240 [Candidatus Roizmanbacteria bacterium RIFCSPLOWO2_02_FULL_43_10]